MSHNNSQGESRYVTLPSDGGGTQFDATNKNNAYKVQMPYTFRCDGPGWEVGLSSLSLPVEDVVRYAMKFIFPSGTKLIRMDFPTKSSGELVQRLTDYVTIDEVMESKEVKDGASFVRRMINLLQRKVGEALMASNTVRDDWYDKTTNERYMFDVKWTSPTSVLWDASKTGKEDAKLWIRILEPMAKHLRIVQYDTTTKKNRRGPNLRLIPWFSPLSGGLTSGGGIGFMSELTEDNVKYVRFTNQASWEWLDLNGGWFEDIVGTASRSLRVYSNVGESMIVGDQVTDLLREVEVHAKGNATVYFEPQHVQYLPVRQPQFDVMEIQVSTLDGRLAKLGTGTTNVTLHFRQREV